MRLFGVPPEKYWEWDPLNTELEPPSYCYAIAKEYQSLRYLKLDPPDNDYNKLLNRIKRMIDLGFPSMFTFPTYDSYYTTAKITGLVEKPEDEFPVGHHSVVAVGYDNANCRLKFRNSAGPNWGIGGYGYLTYDYVLDGKATNFWVLLSREWIDESKFGTGDDLRQY